MLQTLKIQFWLGTGKRDIDNFPVDISVFLDFILIQHFWLKVQLLYQGQGYSRSYLGNFYQRDITCFVQFWFHSSSWNRHILLLQKFSLILGLLSHVWRQEFHSRFKELFKYINQGFTVGHMIKGIFPQLRPLYHICFVKQSDNMVLES